MTVWLAGIIGGFGLICMISKRTLLGLLMGVHILTLGSTLIFVFAGVSSGERVNGSIFGLFIILAGVIQVVVGYALATRLFFLKKQIGIEELRALKR